MPRSYAPTRSCVRGLISYANVPAGHCGDRYLLTPGDDATWRHVRPCMAGHQLLYRFRSGVGELLYVGVTWNPKERWKRHRKSKDWWPDVAFADVECHTSEALAHAAEYLAITTESPRFNRHGIRSAGSAEVSR